MHRPRRAGTGRAAPANPTVNLHRERGHPQARPVAGEAARPAVDPQSATTVRRLAGSGSTRPARLEARWNATVPTLRAQRRGDSGADDGRHPPCVRHLRPTHLNCFRCRWVIHRHQPRPALQEPLKRLDEESVVDQTVEQLSFRRSGLRPVRRPYQTGADVRHEFTFVGLTWVTDHHSAGRDRGLHIPLEQRGVYLSRSPKTIRGWDSTVSKSARASAAVADDANLRSATTAPVAVTRWRDRTRLAPPRNSRQLAPSGTRRPPPAQLAGTRPSSFVNSERAERNGHSARPWSPVASTSRSSSVVSRSSSSVYSVTSRSTSTSD